MPKQELGPFTFEPPTSWSRRAVLIFVGESNNAHPPPNIVVTRDVRGDEELPTHAWRKVFELGRSVPDFEMLGSRETRIDGQPAFKVVVRWRSERGTVTQAMAWVDDRDGHALTITCSAIDKPEAFSEFEHVLETLTFGGARDSMVVPTGRASSPSQPPPENPEMYASVPMPGARPVRR